MSLSRSKSKFDLNANPSMEERKAMVASDYMIAAQPSKDGRYLNAVVTFPQVVAGTAALAMVCSHQHDTLEQALECANQLAHDLKGNKNP